MGRLLSGRNKGNVEIVTSVVALSATLMIIVVGYMVTEQEIAGEVSIAAESRSQQFNSLASLKTVYTFKENHEDMIKFNYPSEEAIGREELKNRLKSSLSYLKDDEVDAYSGEYILKLENPEEDLIIDESEDKVLFKSSAIVASPEKEKSTVTVRSNAY